MSELPCDLVEEILCRVPATSLKRLRLTCKEWNCLFNDMRFSRKHFSKAAKQFMFLTLTSFKVRFLSVSLHNEIPSVKVTSEVSLIDHSNSNQVNIRRVSHCDGLLLCTLQQDTRIVVWNPCTGQTKWIETGKDYRLYVFVLGYYQENQSCNKSYKILSYMDRHIPKGPEFEIYDINSNSWRNLDDTLIPDYHFEYHYSNVSLKGKTYWFAFDEKEEQLDLISFDYTRERFERVHLPYECYNRYEDVYLSVVKEEKLSVLSTSRKEIWVTNKIDDKTKEISWSKLIDVEVLSTGSYTWGGTSLLVDEEKKIYLSKCFFKNNTSVITVSIVGEDNDATQVDLRVLPSYGSFLVDYVPSLTQIQQPVRKRKRGHHL